MNPGAEVARGRAAEDGERSVLEVGRRIHQTGGPDVDADVVVGGHRTKLRHLGVILGGRRRGRRHCVLVARDRRGRDVLAARGGSLRRRGLRRHPILRCRRIRRARVDVVGHREESHESDHRQDQELAHGTRPPFVVPHNT